MVQCVPIRTSVDRRNATGMFVRMLTLKFEIEMFSLKKMGLFWILGGICSLISFLGAGLAE